MPEMRVQNERQDRTIRTEALDVRKLRIHKAKGREWRAEMTNEQAAILLLLILVVITLR